MISAATHAYLVTRRHVDLGRTRSMMCWPHWTAAPRKSPPRSAHRPRSARLLS